MRLEIASTLSPRDAYAAHAGYSSQRTIQLITLHKDGGEVARETIHARYL